MCLLNFVHLAAPYLEWNFRKGCVPWRTGLPASGCAPRDLNVTLRVPRRL